VGFFYAKDKVYEQTVEEKKMAAAGNATAQKRDRECKTEKRAVRDTER
jgi:hypothetical protein